MKKRQDMASYYQFLQSSYSYLSSLPTLDLGVMADSALGRLFKAFNCGYNPNLHSYSDGNDRECGFCLVCRNLNTERVRQRLLNGLLSPLIHRHYSIALSLPKYPAGFPAVDGNRSVGELFYATPDLFRREMREGLGLNMILSELRREAMGAVQDCFPGLKLGAFVGLHLANDWMMFSPHVHMVLCGRMLDAKEWPLKQASDGSFPGLGGAWRGGLGGRRGLTCLKFKRLLRGFWADRFSRWAVDVFLRYRRAFADVETENVAYRFLMAMTEDEIRALEIPLRDAVLVDIKCISVKPITEDFRTGEIDPEKGLEDSLSYGMLPSFKRVEFRDLGAGMVAARFKKKGEWKSCGKTVMLFRRMAQMASVTRLRSYERYGFYSGLAGGKGKAWRAGLLEAMNGGYSGIKK